MAIKQINVPIEIDRDIDNLSSEDFSMKYKDDVPAQKLRTLKLDIQTKKLTELTPNQIAAGRSLNYISEDQRNTYYNLKYNITSAVVSEAASSFGKGLVRGMSNYFNTVADIVDEIPGFKEGVSAITGADYQQPDVVPIDRKDFDKVNTGYGEVVKEIAKFIPAFAAVSTFTGGAASAGMLGARAKTMWDISRSSAVASSWFSKFGATLTTGAVEGGIVDFVFMPPDDPNMADMLSKNPAFKETFIEYLAKDEEDSEITKRLKNTIDGLVMGIAGDALIAGGGAGKKWVQDKLSSMTEVIFETFSKNKKMLKETGLETEYIKDLEKGVENVKTKGMPESEVGGVAKAIDPEASKTVPQDDISNLDVWKETPIDGDVDERALAVTKLSNAKNTGLDDAKINQEVSNFMTNALDESVATESLSIPKLLKGLALPDTPNNRDILRAKMFQHLENISASYRKSVPVADKKAYMERIAKRIEADTPFDDVDALATTDTLIQNMRYVREKVNPVLDTLTGIAAREVDDFMENIKASGRSVYDLTDDEADSLSTLMQDYARLIQRTTGRNSEYGKGLQQARFSSLPKKEMAEKIAEKDAQFSAKKISDELQQLQFDRDVANLTSTSDREALANAQRSVDKLNKKQKHKAMQAIGERKIWPMVKELYKLGLVSSPVTHSRIVLGNTINLAQHAMRRFTKLPVAVAVDAFTDRSGVITQSAMAEVLGITQGFMLGAKRGLEYTLHAGSDLFTSMRKLEPSFDSTRDFLKKNLPAAPGSQLGFDDTFRSALREYADPKTKPWTWWLWNFAAAGNEAIVGSLKTVDELTSVVSYHTIHGGNVARDAVFMSKNNSEGFLKNWSKLSKTEPIESAMEGLRAIKDNKDAIDFSLNARRVKLMTDSWEEVRRIHLQKEWDKNSFLAGMERIAKENVAVDAAMTILNPFMRTSFTELHEMVQNVPILQYASGEFRELAKAARSAKNGKDLFENHAEFMNRLSGGIATVSLLWGALDYLDVTGGSTYFTSNYSNADYTMKIGDKRVKFNGTSPTGSLMAYLIDTKMTAAQMLNSDKNLDRADGVEFMKIMAGAFIHGANSLVNKQYMQTMNRLVRANQSGKPEDYIRVLSQFASDAVSPGSSFVNFVAGSFDHEGTFKSGRSIMENLRKRNLVGAAITDRETQLYTSFDMYGNARKQNYFMTDDEYSLTSKLKMIDLRVSPMDPRKINYRGMDLELNPEQWKTLNIYIRDKSKLTERVTQVLAWDTPDTNQNRRDRVNEQIGNVRNTAIKYTLSKHPELIKQYREKYGEKYKAMSFRRKLLE